VELRWLRPPIRTLRLLSNMAGSADKRILRFGYEPSKSPVQEFEPAGRAQRLPHGVATIRDNESRSAGSTGELSGSSTGSNWSKWDESNGYSAAGRWCPRRAG
jgi:hypothetical protein